MSAYTVLDFKQIQALMSEYGIIPTGFKRFDGGAANSSYQISSADADYVLTVCNAKTYEETYELAQTLEYLLEHALPVCSLVHTKKGALVSWYQQEIPVLLKHHVTGVIHPSFSKCHAREVGHFLGQLHKTPVPNFITRGHAYNADLFESVIHSNLDATYQGWAKEQWKEYQKLLALHLPSGLVHGDLFSDNVLFKEDRLAAVIDWEDVCVYPLMFDIGMTLVGTCFVEKTLSAPLVHALLESYAQVMPLSDLGIEWLQSFAVLAAATTSVWRFQQYHIIEPNPDLFYLPIEMKNKADRLRAKNPLWDELKLNYGTV